MSSPQLDRLFSFLDFFSRCGWRWAFRRAHLAKLELHGGVTGLELDHLSEVSERGKKQGYERIHSVVGHKRVLPPRSLWCSSIVVHFISPFSPPRMEGKNKIKSYFYPPRSPLSHLLHLVLHRLEEGLGLSLGLVHKVIAACHVSLLCVV